MRATENIYIQNNFEAEEGNVFAAYIPEDGPFVYDAIGNLIADQEEGSKISWTLYGKVKEVKTKNDSVVVKFRYDGMGNRIEKRVEKHDTTLVTRYVRDASGNVMTIYKDTTVLEQPIYGSARLGMKVNVVAEGTQILGKRNYELSNHLGNVLSVITDNINMQSDSVWANVVSTSDYYPFGLDMQERSWADTTSLISRYGFNGKEKDSSGEWGNTSYDYGFRIYNPAIAKFLSVDPLTKSYPMLTPYQFASNTPIMAIDLDGLEAFVTIQQQSKEGSYTQVFTTVYESDVEIENRTIHNLKMEFPQAFSNIRDVDGVNILVDSDWKYIGTKKVDGIVFEQDKYGAVDILTNRIAFAEWLEKKVGNPVDEFVDGINQTDIGVEGKVGIPSLNASGKLGSYSTSETNAGYFAEGSANADINNITLSEKPFGFILNAEFFVHLKTVKNDEGTSNLLTGKIKTSYNLGIIKYTSYDDGSKKFSFGLKIKAGDVKFSHGAEGKAGKRIQSGTHEVGN